MRACLPTHSLVPLFYACVRAYLPAHSLTHYPFPSTYAIPLVLSDVSSPVCTAQFHDGLGFLTNHAIISNTFEYSLQKVNPKLTLPYWDFTIESSSAGGIFGESTVDQPQVNSEIFQESWFGTVDHSDDMVGWM